MRATVSDIKNASNYNLVASSWRFLADIKSMNNYFPYGLKVKEGSWSASNYQFAYNGKQEEVFDKNYLDYGARSYDSEEIRFIKTDPKEIMFAYQSPYIYAENNPISKIDQDGKWAVSVHQNITFKVFKELGTSIEESYKIAHYASVYADHPNSIILKLDNLIKGSNNEYQTFRYEYKATKESQDSKNVKWHAMMSDEEYKEGMTREFATQRGLKFGWDNIFSQKVQYNLGKLGQGLHALQDAYAHEGASEFEHIYMKAPYFFYNDWFGDTNEAELITKSAGILLQVFDGNYKNIKNGMSLDFNGMSDEQLDVTKGLFKKAGFELKTTKNEGIYETSKINKIKKK